MSGNFRYPESGHPAFKGSFSGLLELVIHQPNVMPVHRFQREYKESQI